MRRIRKDAAAGLIGIAVVVVPGDPSASVSFWHSKWLLDHRQKLIFVLSLIASGAMLFA